MLMSVECIPCFIKQVMMEMEGSGFSEEKKEEAMRELLRAFSEMDFDKTPVQVSMLIHEKLRRFGVLEDPYLALKRSSTSRALEMLPELRKMVKGAPDPLREAVSLAIAGNVMDYGAANLLSFENILERSRAEEKGLEDHHKLRNDVLKAGRMVYLLDNSGEVVLDRLFMETMVAVNPDLRIDAYVKKAPMLNDVTMDDALEAGVGEVDNVEFRELPKEGWLGAGDLPSLGEWDMFIAKGQGNFESLEGAKGIYFLLVVKCSVIAERLGAGIGDMVLKHSGQGDTDGR